MNARDELAPQRGELQDLVGTAAERDDDDWYRDAANAILAAGYRKPATIHTEDERQRLPDFAVVQTAAGTIACVFGDTAHFFGTVLTAPVTVLALPITILFEPAAEQ